MQNLLKKLTIRLFQLFLLIIGKISEKIALICSSLLQKINEIEDPFDKKNATVSDLEDYYKISRREAYNLYKKLHPEKYEKKIPIYVNGKPHSPTDQIIQNIFSTRNITER